MVEKAKYRMSLCRFREHIFVIFNRGNGNGNGKSDRTIIKLGKLKAERASGHFIVCFFFLVGSVT